MDDDYFGLNVIVKPAEPLVHNSRLGDDINDDHSNSQDGAVAEDEEEEEVVVDRSRSRKRALKEEKKQRRESTAVPSVEKKKKKRKTNRSEKSSSSQSSSNVPAIKASRPPATAINTATVDNEEYITEFHAFFRDQVGLPVKDDQIARDMVQNYHILSASDLCYLLIGSADMKNRTIGQDALNGCVKNPIWIGRTKEYLSNNPNV